MWFHQAAKDLISYDQPKDPDGPRHFELGMGLMIPWFLDEIAERRGDKSAIETARKMRGAIDEFLKENSQ